MSLIADKNDLKFVLKTLVKLLLKSTEARKIHRESNNNYDLSDCLNKHKYI